MKLRIRSNTLRIRLAQDEVQRLAENGSLRDELRFGLGEGMLFSYGIELTASQSSFGIHYELGNITLLMPASLGSGWYDSAEVGFSAEVEVGGGETISLLIEKDFVCLKPRDPEEDKGGFPHPESDRKC
ncbi:MAG: hypothetical protein KDD67_15520 [Ignavibacteriae bacterium]|nr:hypothetical protein [Ignavibacteriota bacterium]MCB9215770.1 hypothetical protein [Ignavibacteria bacterium]